MSEEQGREREEARGPGELSPADEEGVMDGMMGEGLDRVPAVPLAVTTFAAGREGSGCCHLVSWEELVEGLTEPGLPARTPCWNAGRQPAWGPCTWKERAVAASCLVMEVRDGPVLECITPWLERLEFLVHPVPAQKYARCGHRYVLPLTQPVRIEHWEPFYAWASRQLVGGRATADGIWPDRLWECGPALRGTIDRHRGEWLDPMHLLATAAIDLINGGGRDE